MPTATPATNSAKKSTKIAVLESTLEALDAMRGRKSASNRSALDIIHGDPALAFHTVANANRTPDLKSNAFATTGHRALLILGLENFLSLAKSFPATSDADQCLRLSAAHHGAYQAQSLAHRLRGLNADEVIFGGLVKGAIRGQDQAMVHSLKWLPPLARPAKDLCASGRCIEFGHRIAAATTNAWDEEKLADIFREIAEFAHFEPEDAEHLMKQTIVHAASQGRQFGNYRAAINLLSLPAPELECSSAKPQTPPPEPKIQQIKAQPSARGAQQQQESSLERRLKKLQRYALEHGKSSEIFKFALKLIEAEFSFRVALCLVKQKGQESLALRFSEGAALPREFQKLTVELAQSPILAKVFTELDGSVVEGAAVKHEIGGELGRLAGKSPCFIHSVNVNGKPVAMLVALRPKNTTSVAEFKDFERIAKATSQALAARSSIKQPSQAA
ncbi:MAG: hypothetical protein AAF384_06455 [Pseudomonadota bacterium]